MKKIIFTHRIKEGTAKLMASILSSPECCSYYVDGEICRITFVDSELKWTIKGNYLEKYKGQIIYQVRLLNSKEDKEHLVLESQLENLEDLIIVE